MIHFDNAEELRLLAMKCLAKGLTVLRVEELRLISDPHFIGQYAAVISETHKATRAEMAVTLLPANSRAVQLKYLSDLRAIFDNDILSPARAVAASLRVKLNEPSTTAVGFLGAQSTASIKIQVLCGYGLGRMSQLNDDMRKEIGLLYLIATRADEKIDDILREIERQEQFLVADEVPQGETNDQRAAIVTPKGLFSKKFTSEDCEAVLVATRIIYDKEQGYGLQQPNAPALFWGAVQALVNNRIIIGEVRSTFDKLADLYAPTIGRKTDYKELVKGKPNGKLRDGRIQMEKALITAGKLDRKQAFYHIEADRRIEALTPR